MLCFEFNIISAVATAAAHSFGCWQSKLNIEFPRISFYGPNPKYTKQHFPLSRGAFFPPLKKPKCARISCVCVCVCLCVCALQDILDGYENSTLAVTGTRRIVVPTRSKIARHCPTRTSIIFFWTEVGEVRRWNSQVKAHGKEISGAHKKAVLMGLFPSRVEGCRVIPQYVSTYPPVPPKNSDSIASVMKEHCLLLVLFAALFAGTAKSFLQSTDLSARLAPDTDLSKLHVPSSLSLIKFFLQPSKNC